MSPNQHTHWFENEMLSGRRTGSGAAEVASLQHEHVARLHNAIRVSVEYLRMEMFTAENWSKKKPGKRWEKVQLPSSIAGQPLQLTASPASLLRGSHQ